MLIFVSTDLLVFLFTIGLFLLEKSRKQPHTKRKQGNVSKHKSGGCVNTSLFVISSKWVHVQFSENSLFYQQSVFWSVFTATHTRFVRVEKLFWLRKCLGGESQAFLRSLRPFLCRKLSKCWLLKNQHLRSLILQIFRRLWATGYLSQTPT